MQTETLELSEAAVTAWARLVRVSQAVMSKVEADLKAAGFPPLAWYDALLELERAEPDGLRPYLLQKHMLLAQYNLSRLTDRLTKAGYVEREACCDDGRGQVLKISREGRKLRRRMWPAYRKGIATHFAEKLNADETEALARTLKKLG
jgi:DNA-binding MarR family transcriptional regulator